MEKFREPKAQRTFSPYDGYAFKKIIRMLRFTVFCFFLGLIQLMAVESYSQQTKLSLDESNQRLENVLKLIEDRSEFFFIYNRDLIDVNQTVDIKVNDQTISSILDKLLKGTNINYSVVNRQIVLASSNSDFTASAQQKSISGKVVDNTGMALPGVTVVIKGTTTGTITDVNGGFVLGSVPSNATLVFSFVGMKTFEVAVAGNSVINVTMEEESIGLEEVVAVGYGTQTKATLTGSVASIKSEDIVVTKNQNLQNTLTGKMPGVRVVQRTSEPGTFDNQFDIRGFGSPLVVVDGVPRDNFTRLDPNDIESVSVLKDAAAAVYGVRAGNGVVLITTKKGEKGKAKIEYSYMTGFQNPTGLPSPLDAIDRFTIFNEKSMHNINSPTLTYDDDVMQPFLDGTRESTDWYGEVMRSNAPQSQQNLSASGGSEKIDYYINMGYSYQGGFWKSNDLNYKKYNVRANLNAQITEQLKASLKVSGILDEQNRPYRDSWEIFKNLWRSHPDDPYYANNNPDYIYKNQADYNPGAIADADISGNRVNINRIFQSSFSLDYEVPFIKGLTASGLFSYDFSMNDRTDYQKIFYEYEYNATTDEYMSTSYQSPNRVTRNYSSRPSKLLQLSLKYKANINEKHFFDALALFEESNNSGDGFYAQRELSIAIPYLFAGNADNQVGNASSGGVYENTNKGLVGRLDYNYSGKYLFTFSFRYDGSSKFPTNKQWGFFPSYRAAWRVSEEGFFKNSSSLSFINNLKLRASYGVMGDDGASRFQFITGYDYPFSGGNSQKLASGYLFDSWTSSLGFRNVANPNITWYTLKTTNLGLDANLWDNLLGINLDIFRRDRSGLLANRLLSLPLSFGANLPQENLNSDRTEGFELALTHRNKITTDLSINLSANIAYTRTKNIYVERAEDGSSYAKWRNDPTNRYNDIWFGLGYEGQYQSYEEIKYYPVYTSRGVLPGDYIYDDWNEDGIIDNADRHPIATTTNPSSNFNGKRNYPLLNFGFNIGVNYKRFDVNALFQGAAKSYAAYGEMYQSIVSNALDFFMDRWHPVDSRKDPYDPTNEWIQGRLAYTGTTYDIDSERGIQNTSYLRLKSIELGYTLPERLTQKIGMSNLRIFANGYNLLTFTKAIGVDPEHPSDLYGYLYPMNKVVNVGASLRF
ncbi:TonB-dependent receptor [Sunxiuqinia sp. A32]|uniref:TonB-dependent receptor n=1 Tax=Sunxiuqinia sp. A32 TaxID=3461496 RepID=UPI00404593B6